MTSKAELAAELEKLRARRARPETEADRSPGSDPGSQAAVRLKTSDEIRSFLEEHGFDLSKLESVGEDVVEEFGRLQKDYPLTVLLLAFALGYVVGRAQG
ncbi:MAG: hypothetical protein AAF408_12580 [Pseudomonadota bacterium]